VEDFGEADFEWIEQGGAVKSACGGMAWEMTRRGALI
jgi:hypothetical protein